MKKYMDRFHAFYYILGKISIYLVPPVSTLILYKERVMKEAVVETVDCQVCTAVQLFSCTVEYCYLCKVVLLHCC